MPRPAKNKGKAKGHKRKAKYPYGSRPMIRGHGAYTYDNPGPFGQFGRKYGPAAGAAVGGAFGGKPGAMIGGYLGKKLGGYLHYIGKLFGSGAYITSPASVKHNVLVNGDQVPGFGSTNTTVTVKHREYLGDIYSSGSTGSFELAAYPINPGVSTTFPWLSNVCGASFQQYRMNGLVFEYRTMSSDALNSTNTALGTVVMATDYDSKDQLFATKQEMENTQFAVSSKPSCSMLHAIECARSQTSISEQYIRAFAVPSGADVRLYDLGNFQIATVGMQAANVLLGELWCSYSVTLLKAIQQPPAFLNPVAHYKILNSAAGTNPFTVDTSFAQNYDNIGLTFPNGFTMNFPSTIPVGSIWQVFANYAGTTGTAASNLSITPGNGMQEYACFASGAGYQTCPQPGASILTKLVNIISYWQYVGGGNIDNPPNLLISIPGVPLANYLDCDLFVTEVSALLPNT